MSENIKLKHHAERTSILKQQLEDLQALYDAEEEKLKKEMKEEGLKQYFHNGFKFEFGERQNRGVDKEKFYDLVTPEDFFEAAKIGVTEAKKFVPGRLLDDCMVYGDPTLYFKVSSTKKAKEEAVKQVAENTEVIRTVKRDLGKGKKVERI